MSLCAICGAGKYCWLHDQPALDPPPRIPPGMVLTDPAVAAPGWRPARPGDTPGELTPELAREAVMEAHVAPEVADLAKYAADRALGFPSIPEEGTNAG